jgi:hypothetical protein
MAKKPIQQNAARLFPSPKKLRKTCERVFPHDLPVTFFPHVLPVSASYLFSLSSLTPATFFMFEQVLARLQSSDHCHARGDGDASRVELLQSLMALSSKSPSPSPSPSPLSKPWWQSTAISTSTMGGSCMHAPPWRFSGGCSMPSFTSVADTSAPTTVCL